MLENKHGNRTQIAAERLRRMIVAGDLAPGQRISERAIREHLEGLSRTPLREAFKILAGEGLVTISPNRGATVTALSMVSLTLTGLINTVLPLPPVPPKVTSMPTKRQTVSTT